MSFEHLGIQWYFTTDIQLEFQPEQLTSDNELHYFLHPRGESESCDKVSSAIWLGIEIALVNYRGKNAHYWVVRDVRITTWDEKSSDVELVYNVTWRNNNAKEYFNVGSKCCNNIMSGNSEHNKSTRTTHLVTVHIASNAPISRASSLTTVFFTPR